MNPPIKTPKKLIEVALPLDDINAASGKEKSIRHGHPSTLHLWWARRPLAAARAVIFAQMVNDPGYQQGNGFRYGVNKEQAAIEREKLFNIIRDLVKWENTNNEEVLARAREAIRKSWRETCELNRDHPESAELFDPDKLPDFHDPFAGGGAIPLEAMRLGLEAHATDLNPIPVLINKCQLEVISRFDIKKPVSGEPKDFLENDSRSSIGHDFVFYANRVLDISKEEISDNYQEVSLPEEMGGGKAPVITWLWCRTVASPNPIANGQHTPLIKSPFLSNRKGRYIWVDVSIEEPGNLSFSIKSSTNKPTIKGTIGRAGATCLYSNSPIPLSYIREQGKNGALGQRIIAAVVIVGGKKVYISGDEVNFPEVSVPAELPSSEILHWSGCTNVCVYGMTKFEDLFNSRQKSAMHTFAKNINNIHSEIVAAAKKSGLDDNGQPFSSGASGATAYADAICLFLACCLGRCADYWSSVTSWESSGEFVAHTFTKHALPMIWDYGEVNPLADGGGSWASAVDWIRRVIERLPYGIGFAKQHNAMRGYSPNKMVVSTDPPYYDNVPYSNLSDYFYMWTRIALKQRIPESFGTIQTPKHDEIIASHSLHENIDDAMRFFTQGMGQALKCIRDEAASIAPVTIYYAFKQSETSSRGTSSSGWESFLESVIGSGFSITGTWPIRTERANRGRAIGANALASSIVLVCRSRPPKGESITRRQFQSRLRDDMPEALEAMIGGSDGASPIAPVDLAQAAIGPGIGIFSQYEAVLNQDGTRMSVHDALILINRAITDYLNPDSGIFDNDTLFCDSWFAEYGWSAGEFGQADTLARAKGTTVDGVRDAGVIESGGGMVRLYRWKEYPEDWDPIEDNRTPVWEALHQLIRALNEQGETGAGALLARMPERGEAIRQLAYHLYTLCERKGWAEDARAYNELIAAWHGIVAASHEAGHIGEQSQLEL